MLSLVEDEAAPSTSGSMGRTGFRLIPRTQSGYVEGKVIVCDKFLPMLKKGMDNPSRHYDKIFREQLPLPACKLTNNDRRQDNETNDWLNGEC